MKKMQTESPPFSSYLDVSNYFETLENENTLWSEFGLLTDENHHNSIFVLLENEVVIAAFRANICEKDAWKVTNLFAPKRQSRFLFTSKSSIQKEDILSLEKVSVFLAHCSRDGLIQKHLKQVFEEPKKGVKHGKGRGEKFSTDTGRKVFDDASMRCMFEGCAEKLNQNELSGDDSYFGYLAHIVASSEEGPRGEVGESALLSDVPSNVMLLCDKCHRLIDRVACADFPRDRLEAMRTRFITDKNALLDLLKFHPVKTYSFCWPINGQPVSPPTPREVSNCLATSFLRSSGELQIIDDSNISGSKDDKSDDFWKFAPHMLRASHAHLEQTAQSSGQSYGIFASGPMPLLVSLGALIGNKNNVMAALRTRELGQWCWPLQEPVGAKILIVEPPIIPQNLDSVVIRLELTASPNSLSKRSEEILSQENSSEIIVTVKEQSGNCIGHPADGLEFQHLMNILLHKISTDYKVSTIHLLPCASNAACLYFGRAIEQYHPKVIVSDFLTKDKVVPRIKISPTECGPSLSSPTED